MVKKNVRASLAFGVAGALLAAASSSCLHGQSAEGTPAAPGTKEAAREPARLPEPEEPLVSNASAPRGTPLKGADLREVTPASSRVLTLTFIDGKARFPAFGKGGHDGSVEYSLLDVERARQPGAYRITSPDDPAYASPRHPVKVGRKSKGQDFARAGGDTFWVMNHALYLVLPEPMKSGKTYRVEVDGLSSTRKDVSLVFDEKMVRSETVRVNQLGYVPKAMRKAAYLSHWMGDLGPLTLDEYAQHRFSIVEEKTGKAVYSGTPKLRARASDNVDSPRDDEPRNYSGADVWELDFSEFREPGTYYIVMKGIGRSYSFAIDPDLYRRAYITAARGVFLHRSGIEIKKEHGGQFARPACHHPDINGTVYQQTTIRYMDEPHSHGPPPKPEQLTKEVRKVWGGYQDAGDWDREGNHLDIPAYLLTAFELRPNHYADGELTIPESGNGIPDIVDEARWGVDYYRRLQRPHGGVGVGAFAHSYPKGGETCWTDTHPWYLYAEEPQMSYRYVAAALQLAHVLDGLGKREDARAYVASAEKAWRWAGANLRPGDEAKVRDSRLWASAWMYKVLGDAKYLEAFRKDLVVTSPTTPLYEWGKHDQRFGVVTYLNTKRADMDEKLRGELQQAVLHFAEKQNVEPGTQRVFRVGYNWQMPMFWGSGAHLRAEPLMVAHYLSGDERYLEPYYTSADFVLGGNPLNMTWMTGLGSRYPKQVFNINTWYTETREPVHGLMPFGPHRYEEGEVKGPWEPRFAQATAYPHAKKWPPYELFFEIRGTPATNEYVTATSASAAAQFGYLAEPVR